MSDTDDKRPRPSRLEERVSRLERAFERLHKVDLDAIDADDAASRERGAAIEAARVEEAERAKAIADGSIVAPEDV